MKKYVVLVTIVSLMTHLTFAYSFQPMHSLSKDQRRVNTAHVENGCSYSLQNKEEQDLEENYVEVILTYQPAPTHLISYENLRLRWLFLFVEQLAKANLEDAMQENFGYYDVYTTGKKLSASLISIQFACPQQQNEEAINYLLQKIDQMKNTGFTDAKAFEDMRQEYLIDVGNLLAQSNDEQYPLYSYLNEEYATLNAYISFDEFLKLSYELLQEISLADLEGLPSLYFDEAHRKIACILPENFYDQDSSSDDIEEEDEFNALSKTFMSSYKENVRGFSSLKEGFADEESVQTSPDLFFQLPINETDKKFIKKIITTMADKNVFQLLLDKKTLEKKGKKIRHVHPLRFMGFICSDPHLRKCLHSISKNHFKWSNFIDGFEERMKEESKRGQLLPYVPGFAELLNADPVAITNFINRAEYEKLILYFL